MRESSIADAVAEMVAEARRRESRRIRVMIIIAQSRPLTAGISGRSTAPRME
jgi:hypothetical protein